MNKYDFFYYFQRRFRSFSYNFRWSTYIWMLNGWLPRAAILVPLIGYLIIFNDYISANITFYQISGPDDFFLTSSNRLRFVYFGLIFLASSNFLYRFSRPWIFRYGESEFEFTDNGLKFFTSQNYMEFHQTIRTDGHYTRNGKYYDSMWDGFYNMAVGKEGVEKNIPGNWTKAKSQYEDLLKCILHETFFRYDVKKRTYLIVCIFLASIGYFLLIVPSVELFLRVLISML